MTETSWQYLAESRAGKLVRGAITGADEAAALSQLAREGLRPISLKQSSRKPNSLLSNLPASNKLPGTVMTRIFRSLADLLGSGIELSDALHLLITRETKTDGTAWLQRLHEAIRSGAALSEAIAQDRIEVLPYVTALIEAGETTGDMATQLDLIANTLEAQQKMKSDLVAQLIYPASLCILIALTIVFLSYFVLPQFETIFVTADASPPSETVAVLAIGSAIRNFGAWFPAAFFGGLLVLLFAKHRYSDALSDLVLRLPWLGSVKRRLETVRYMRVLGAMTHGGAPLSSGLPVATRALASPALKTRYAHAGEAVRAGQSLSVSLERENVTTSEVLQLVEIGEKSGRLGEMLLKAADLCESDVVALLKRIAAIAGPVLTALMGLITAGVIAAVMSGVLSLNDAIYG